MIKLNQKQDIDFTNQKFGYLTVLKRATGYSKRWECLCECGNKKIVEQSRLPKTKSCGCKAKEYLTTKFQSSSDTFKKFVFREFERQAIRRGIGWNLSPDEVYFLITKNCFYCSSQPDKTKKIIRQQQTEIFKYNGLDRVDPSKEYTANNVVPCCKICNFAKLSMSSADFYSHIDRIYKNLQLKGIINSIEDQAAFGEKIGLQASILILAFERPEETRILLNSIKRHIKFDRYEIILYVNGGESSPFWEMYKEGLIDKIIISRENQGSGVGTVSLIKACATNLFIYLQNDNYFIKDITQDHIDWINKAKSEKIVGGFDLTGLVPNHHKFSERAFISWRKYYIGNRHLGVGGTGPYSYIEGSEPAFTSLLDETGKKMIPFHGFVGDSGKYSVVQLPCGGVLKRRCDTQELLIQTQPKEKTPIFNISDSEWDIILAGQWDDWRIPEKSKEWVFLFYSNTFENPANEIYRRK